MKNKLPTFTLIRKSNISDKDKSLVEDKIKTLPQDISTGFDKINSSLRSAIYSTTLSDLTSVNKRSTKKTNISDKALREIATELSRTGAVKTIGILDLGSWLGSLPKLLEVLNRAQSAFTFFEVQSVIPAGIISQHERVIEWVKQQGIKLSKTDKEQISNNIIADEFFPYAEKIRRDLGLNFIIGITPAMIAGTNDNDVFWNHFAIGVNKTILISTADLRDFAKKAGRPFEVAIGYLLVGQLIGMLSPKIDFHPENRECLFDYNVNRASLINGIKNPHIEETCLEKIPSSIRQSVQALVHSLSNIR